MLSRLSAARSSQESEGGMPARGPRWVHVQYRWCEVREEYLCPFGSLI